jgi:ABC-type amino acid transport system permease subunit
MREVRSIEIKPEQGISLSFLFHLYKQLIIFRKGKTMKTYKFFGLLTVLALLIVGLPMMSARAASATLYVDVDGEL